MDNRFVILGGGQAGATAAALLRQKGFTGQITLLCDEADFPYERPPLSKAMLLDEHPALQPILPPSWWQEQRVEVQFNSQIVALKPDTRQLERHDGSVIAFDKLLIATGARARKLPLLDALGARATTLRHAGDARQLRTQLRSGQRLIVVGAGTIGLEVAATARQCGCEVTVIEAAPVLMGRNTPPPIQSYLLDYHRQRGVTFHFNSQIECASADDGVTLTLQQGEQIHGDHVVYGIGIEPNDQLAQAAGLATHNGIIIDALCRTSHPDIFAAGDVCLQRHPDGNLVRLETWENANRQADIATAAMLHQAPPVHGAPWFWTDQYDLNLQFIGNTRSDHWLCRGAANQRIWLSLNGDRLGGAITLNQGREVRVLRKLIDSDKALDAAQLTDTSVALKSLLK